MDQVHGLGFGSNWSKTPNMGARKPSPQVMRLKPTLLGPQMLSPPGSHLLRQGLVYRLAPVEPFFRGMPTGSKAFLESSSVTGPVPGSHVKKTLYQNLVWWDTKQMPIPGESNNTVGHVPFLNKVFILSIHNFIQNNSHLSSSPSPCQENPFQLIPHFCNVLIHSSKIHFNLFYLWFPSLVDKFTWARTPQCHIVIYCVFLL